MDISSLLSSLSQEDIEKLKATAQQFFGQNEDSSGSVKEEKESTGMPFSFDPKMLTGVARLSKMMNENDEKSNFILALKPLLSDSRRKKADDAVMILKFMRIMNTLQENTK
ncbi:MAG: hypothetical protein IJO68_02310 [Clostridia bacterium]|nr:hypothetical protein [Clostridia bacterium]